MRAPVRILRACESQTWKSTSIIPAFLRGDGNKDRDAPEALRLPSLLSALPKRLTAPNKVGGKGQYLRLLSDLCTYTCTHTREHTQTWKHTHTPQGENPIPPDDSWTITWALKWDRVKIKMRVEGIESLSAHAGFAITGRPEYKKLGVSYTNWEGQRNSSLILSQMKRHQNDVPRSTEL